MCNFHTVGEIFFIKFRSPIILVISKRTLITMMLKWLERQSYTEAVSKRKKQFSGHLDMKTTTYKMHDRKVIEDKQTVVKSFNTMRRNVIVLQYNQKRYKLLVI